MLTIGHSLKTKDAAKAEGETISFAGMSGVNLCTEFHSSSNSCYDTSVLTEGGGSTNVANSRALLLG